MKTRNQQSTSIPAPGKGLPAAGAPRATRGVASPAKVLRMLMAFSPERPTARVEELARIVGVPLSTAYRYLALLRDTGLVADHRGGEYHLTAKVFSLAQAARLAGGLHAIVRPVLHALREQTGESVLFLRRVGLSAVCSDMVESGRPMRLSFVPGQPMPLYRGAGAKLLLATMDREDVESYLSGKGVLPPSLARRRARIADELAALAKRGWAISEGEVDDGVWAAAALVRSGDEVMGAVSVAGPSFRLTAEKRRMILARVRAAGADLSMQLESL